MVFIPKSEISSKFFKIDISVIFEAEMVLNMQPLVSNPNDVILLNLIIPDIFILSPQ